MKKKVQLKQEHIDNGVPYEPRGCAVALALKDAWIKFDHGVGPDDTEINGARVLLPVRVQRFIRKFDRGVKETCKPFRFWITLPE